jgi:tetratricopeptide (TPR) repeat protein
VKPSRWIFALAITGILPVAFGSESETFQQGLKALAGRDYDLAIACFSEEIRLHPNEAASYANRGNAYAAKGEFDKAIADFTRAIRLNPQDAHVYNNRGYAYDGRGKYDRAIADFDEAIRLDPKDADAYYNRGNSHRMKGDYDLAISDYSQALRLRPKFAQAYNSRGNAYLDKGNYLKAVTDFNQAIRLDPELARAYDGRGLAQEKIGEFAKAIADHREALRLNPQSSSASNNLAWVLATCPKAELRDGQKAVEYATKACQLTAWKDPFCLGTLAAANAEVGKFDDAVGWQKKALEFPQAYGTEALAKARARLTLYEGRQPYREEN